jgi:hypothetical protein
MPLAEVFVNLWKTSEVSYRQLDSYSTGVYFTPVVGIPKSTVRAASFRMTNMVLRQS